MEEPKTIIKIKLTRTNREVLSLVKLLTLFGLIIAAMGTCQVVICQRLDHKKTIGQCIAPRLHGSLAPRKGTYRE